MTCMSAYSLIQANSWQLPIHELIYQCVALFGFHFIHSFFNLSPSPNLGFDRYGNTDTDTYIFNGTFIDICSKPSTNTPFQNSYQTDINICFGTQINPNPIACRYLYQYKAHINVIPIPINSVDFTPLPIRRYLYQYH